MNCYEFQDNISAYIEKELALPQVRRFDQHLDTCATCRDFYEGVVSLIHILRNSEKLSVPGTFNAELKSRLEKLAESPVRRLGRYVQGGRILGFQPRYAVLSVAAMTAIVLLSISLFPRGNGTPLQTPVPLSTQQRTTSPMGNPGLNLPTSSAIPYLAEESSDDSTTDADLDVERSAPTFDGKIRLVKDQQ